MTRLRGKQWRALDHRLVAIIPRPLAPALERRAERDDSTAGAMKFASALIV